MPTPDDGRSRPTKKLGELLGDSRVRMRTLYNLWGGAVRSGAAMTSQTLADELLAVAVKLADEQSLCEAHIAQASSLYNRSHFAEALEHAHFVTSRPTADLDAVLPASGVIQACLYGGVAAAALAFIGEAKDYLAEIDRALHRSDADVLAPVLAPLSSSVIAVWMRDFDVVHRTCDELETIGRQLDSDILIGWSEIYGGWAQAMVGDAQSGVERTSRGVAKHVAANQRLGLNHSLGLLAEAQAAAGRTNDAFATVADALQLRDLAFQRQHTCELLRIELCSTTPWARKNSPAMTSFRPLVWPPIWERRFSNCARRSAWRSHCPVAANRPKRTAS